MPWVAMLKLMDFMGVYFMGMGVNQSEGLKTMKFFQIVVSF